MAAADAAPFRLAGEPAEADDRGVDRGATDFETAVAVEQGRVVAVEGESRLGDLEVRYPGAVGAGGEVLFDGEPVGVEERGRGLDDGRLARFGSLIEAVGRPAEVAIGEGRRGEEAGAHEPEVVGCGVVVGVDWAEADHVVRGDPGKRGGGEVLLGVED